MKRRRIDWPRVGFALLSAWVIYEMAQGGQMDVSTTETNAYPVELTRNEGWRW